MSSEHKGSITNSLTKCTIRDLGVLSLITTYSECVLQKTTFHHLLNKFDRAETAASSSNFLAATINQYLRFCPRCIEEWNYYKLIWRFSFIKYCLEHCCALLDCCGYCGQAIPLLPTPLTFGQCPHCQKELKGCEVKKLLNAEKSDYLSLLKIDIEFLLSPHPCEILSAKLLPFIGEQLRLRRIIRQESIRDVARKLRMPSSEVLFIEDGRTKMALPHYNLI